MEEVDEFDRRILALMKVDSRRTGDQLSGDVGLSPAACLRRVQRLRKIGAIEREVAIVSPKLEDRPLVIVVLLSIEGHNPKTMDEFCRYLRKSPTVNRRYCQVAWRFDDD